MDRTSGPARAVIRCPHCQKALAVPPEKVGVRARCPACREVFRVELPDAPAAAEPAAGGRLCAVCQCPIGAEVSPAECPECRTPYHQDCWEYNGGCAVYGCPAVPETEPLSALEVPPSYWGAEEKQCPKCAQTIQAAAIRCRHCGATFGSARPENTAEFQHRTAREKDLPALKRRGVWLLVFGLLSCTAPLAALVGTIWYRRHREAIESLPSLNVAVSKIAVLVALVQTGLLVLLAVLYGVFG